MSSNRVILGASLIYSLFLVLASSSYEPSSIFNLVRHLVEETPKNYSFFSVIHSNVMKAAFVYSIAIVFLSTTITFASFSSFRELITAVTRHWKPFLASIVAAVIFPAILRPPPMFSPFGTYFNVTLFHALFVVYFSVKHVTVPMLEEKFGNDVLEVPKNFSMKFIFTQLSMSVMEIVTLRLSIKEEGYKMQVVVLVLGIVCEVMHMIWLATFYELMVFSLFVYENNKKKKMLAGEAGNGSSESSVLLVENSMKNEMQISSQKSQPRDRALDLC